MPIRHLLKSLEKRKRFSGDGRPGWLVELIESTAQLFEPLVGISRVGYDCWPTDDGWTLCLYLGDTEIVGGCEDGKMDPPDFRFDLLGLIGLLGDLQRIRWSVFPGSAGDELGDRSYLSVIGDVAGNRVCVRLLSVAPDAAGPALKLFPNGDCRRV